MTTKPSLAEQIGALTQAIEQMQIIADRGGMDVIAARGTVKILSALRDEKQAEMNGMAGKEGE